ncbi:hypothetical protein NE237_021598 [Protea cynaroides]|uniref:Uncharacterized protein n=1 Tax=Protea cynaroides TaxID=273540 RepID=A0A9Q0HBH9_9MAGN|nr:hypothetical protein NE237_021598 [Protea cynaroides]
MEDEGIKPSSEAFPMNGGDGPYRYNKNSIYQKQVTNASKARIDETVAKKLDIRHPSFTNTSLRKADLGCSVVPNAFIAMQNIVEAIKLKKYFAGGVLGSFHGHLFPKASLHLVLSSSALHWISKVPKEVLDKDSCMEQGADPLWKVTKGSS